MYNHEIIAKINNNGNIFKYLRIGIGCVLGYWIVTEVRKDNIIIRLILAILLLLWFVAIWLQYYTLIFDKNGCIKKFLFYKKRYTWDELVIKQEYNTSYYSLDAYREGVFFSTQKVFPKKMKQNIDNYLMLHPFSSMNVSFEGTFRWENIKDGDALRSCEVNKEYFFQKMEEWRVHVNRIEEEHGEELERRKIPEQLVMELDKQRKKWTILIPCLCNGGIIGLIVMGGGHYTKEMWCFGIAALGILNVMLIVALWYRSYKIIFDSEGCTRIWAKYKKRYTWERLIVRKRFISKEDKQEGVLFAIKDENIEKFKNLRKYFVLHPFSSFIVNFEKEEIAYGYLVTTAVDKEVFMRCLNEWGIELEDTRFRKQESI